MTRGHKSSEFRWAKIAFIVNMAVVVYAIYQSVELSGLGGLITAANTPIMAYIFGRSWYKSQKGENDA